MENLKQLVAIKSDKNGDEIIQYLNMRFTQLAQEIKIIKNKENNTIRENNSIPDLLTIIMSEIQSKLSNIQRSKKMENILKRKENELCLT